jgi:L-lactate dehydrogenase complex protein LldG
MSSRETILKRLRSAQTPFVDLKPIEERKTVSPESEDLKASFIKNASALGIKIFSGDDEGAIEYILGVIGEDKQILSWDLSEISLKSFGAALQKAEIAIAPPRSDGIRFGITGVDAALAATGSIVVSTSKTKPRSASLLPYVHLAVLKTSQILPHLEAWISQNKVAIAKNPNHIIITGPSRTADIAMELVMGAHGPAELHLVILD